MRQIHLAGEKMFVDDSGKRPEIVDARTGEVTPVELFVAVLGASNHTCAEATWTQGGPDWIASHVRALAFFGGVPKAIACDCLKSGVTRACRHEPEVRRTYEDLVRHYGTTVLRARPYKARDGAEVEVGVQIVQRWILARIRNEVFHSLDALNGRIREPLADFNSRTMSRYKKSRRELFESIERSALAALPTSRFEYAEWKKARVNIDYHVLFDEHSYSVPYQLVHEETWLRATGTSIEVLLHGRRVASHARSHVRFGFTTLTEHMPSAHRAHAEWTPSRIPRWAGETGPEMRALCEAILRDRPRPEQGFKSCLGILRLGKRCGAGQRPTSTVDQISAVLSIPPPGRPQDAGGRTRSPCTEAAAATAVVMADGAGPAPEPRRFVADHPFPFLIRDMGSRAILFLGRVVDPRSR